MKKNAIAILACMTLSMLALDALQPAEEVLVQEQKDVRDTTIDIHAKRGPRGHRGHRGKKGHRGRIGAAGPQGPAGTPAVLEFAEAYLNIAAGTPMPIPTGPATLVPFNALGPHSSNITYDAGTQTFTLLTAGTYSFEYGVTASTLASDAGSPLDLMKIYLEFDLGPTQGMTDVAAAPPADPNTPYTSFANASNQLTVSLAAGTTVQLYVTFPPQAGTFIPYYGLPGNAEQAAYISIQKIGS